MNYCNETKDGPEIKTNAELGDMFIHRKIANQEIHTNFNDLSVLQYTDSVLTIKHNKEALAQFLDEDGKVAAETPLFGSRSYENENGNGKKSLHNGNYSLC